MRTPKRFPAPPLTLLIAIALVSTGPSHATEAPGKKAFALEDLYRLTGVGNPCISPDGRTVVYEVTTSEIRTSKRSVNLWRTDPDGKNARALTFSDGKRNESATFSPDGKTLAFVSDRSGEPQLWLLPLGGGEAQKRTDVPGGITGPVFSPDGKRIAFATDVHPECGADMACNKKLDEAREKGKLKAHLADRLLYRHWDAWRDGKRSHIFLLDLTAEKAEPKELTPGDLDAPVFSLGGPPMYAYSPDGKELTYASNHDQNEASSTNADLFTVSLEGNLSPASLKTRMASVNDAWDGSPAYSPDGRYLAWRAQSIPGYESDLFRIVLYDRNAGKGRTLLPKFDDTIGKFTFSRDSKRIYFTADVKGRTPLYELDLATGALRVLTAEGNIDSFEVAPDGKWVAIARRRVGEPSELWRLELAAGKPAPPVRVTFHNAAVEKEVDIRPAEEISVPGVDGKPVQVWIVKPYDFDDKKKYPLILNIHGGPQQQWADSFRGDWQVYPGAGYVVAFPNPHGSTGFGSAYTAAISGDWNGKVMEDVEKVADALARLPWVDADRMGAMGWSWGGYAVMWLEGHTARFKALAAMMGVYDLRSMYSATEELWFPEWDLKGNPWDNPSPYEKMSPSGFVRGFRTPCLVVTGEKDYRVPYTQSLMFFTDLQKKGVPSRLLVFEKAGHWPAWYEMAAYYAAHLDWFHRYLGGAPSPWDPKELVGNTLFGTDEPGKK